MRNKFLLSVLVLSFLFSSNARGMQHNHSSSEAKIDCVINSGACAKVTEQNMQAVFDINPKPVKPMNELLFSVTLNKGESPVTDAAVSLDLTMPDMFMGVNKPVLAHKGDGRYEGKGVIPTCPHGGKVWKADVEIVRHGKNVSVSYVFEVD